VRAPEPKPEAPRPPDAGAFRRLVAAVVDALVVNIGAAVLVSPVLYYWWVRDLGQPVPWIATAASLAVGALATALACVYHVYFWGVKGATPGKRLVEIEVEGEDGQFPIGAGRAAVRLLGYLLSGALFGVGFVMIAFGAAGLHDRIAGTRVVPQRARN
jgi:uncharacterized RDD family membrane protein YckC